MKCVSAVLTNPKIKNPKTAMKTAIKSDEVEIEFHAIDGGKPGAGLRPRANAGGQNERFRQYRISYFWLQARRKRNCGSRFLGASSIRRLGEGCFSALALSIPCSGGWRLTSVRWGVHRFSDRRKNDLES